MFGDYLVVSLFAAWAVAAGGQRLAYFALPVLFAGVLATASNGCLVSVIAGVGTVVIAHRSFWKPRQLGAVLLAVGVLLGTVAVFYDQIQEAAMERFSGGRSEIGGAAAKGAGERLPIWENLIVQVMQRPLGVGPGGFGDINAETTGDHHAAHSEYLGMLAERGFLGFAGWCGVMGGILLMVRRIAAASTIGYRPFGVPQTYGLFGAMAAHALVIELSHFRHTWLIFAVLAAAAAQATARTADAEPIVLREAA
jgi:O-antigen ligase